MWPFRRNRPAAEAPAPAPAATGPVHRAGPAAWRDAPPLRVLQPSRTTIDQAFVSGLATRADPSFLGALGHHVIDEGPAGSVHGLAVADHAPRSFAPPPSAGHTAQRMIADPIRTTAPAPSARPHTDVADLADLADLADEPTAVAVPLAATSRHLVDASVVDLPPVPARAAVQLRPVPDAVATDTAPRPTVPTPVAAPETAPTTERGAPPVASATTAATFPINPTIGTSGPTPTPVASPAPSTPPIVSRVIEGGPAAGRPRPRIGAPIERPTSTTADGLAATHPAMRRPVDEPRRTPDRPTGSTGARPDGDQAGLVGDSPLGPHVPEAAADGVRPPARLVVPTVQTSVTQPAGGPTVRPPGRATPAPPSTTGAPPAASGPAPVPTRVAPIGPPVQRRADEPLATPAVTPTVGIEPLIALSTDGPAATPPLDAVAPAAPSGPTGPRALPTRTVASQPTVLRQLVGSTPTQAAATFPTPGAPRLGGEARPGPVVVATPIGPSRTASEVTVPAFGAVVAPTVQLVPLLGDRTVGTPRSDPDQADGRSATVAAPALARPGATGPSASSPLAGPAPAASASSTLTVVARSASMPAAVSRLVEAASAAPAASSSGPAAPTSPARSTESYVPPWVQRAEDPAGTSATATTDVAPSAAATVDAGDTTPREPSAAEIDRLAQALYPQLRRRLGRDLLNDRERLGYRTDIRF